MASRFSFVVSKKIDSRATKRNVLRRRGYEAVAKIIDEAKPQHVFLFFPKKTSTDLSFEAFSKEIKQLITMVQ
jgi:ribonuclease P protein component